MTRHPVTSEERSALMRRVRQGGTDIEDETAALLRELRIAYRRNVVDLPGRPDFANKRRGWALFVHGCFWHFHEGCRLSKMPTNNAEFWLAKRAANRERDARKVRQLKALKFRVGVVWQCELDKASRVKRRLSKLTEARTV